MGTSVCNEDSANTSPYPNSASSQGTVSFGDYDIAVRCCALDGSAQFSPDCNAYPKTYEEAVALCDNHDYRLCTMEEVAVYHQNGCMFDHAWLWTSTECTITNEPTSPTSDTDSITFVKRDCRVPDEGNGLGDYGNHNGQPKTLDECMDLCQEHGDCRSFTFSESGQKCHLKDKVVTEEGGCKEGGGWNFETYYLIDEKQSSAAYKPYERTYGAYRRDPYERTYGHAYGAYRPYERTYGADAEEEGVLSVLPESTTPALIAREKSGFTSVAAQPVANYCCHSETVDGWNGNYNGVCFGHQTEEDCDSNECYWDAENCRRELTCLLRDVECESNDDCCSGRCKVDDLLCR